uniref:Uncharacterized protein n=1 Tax=Setaria italica TaxID=4555 RepID=K3Z2P7_SETIT
MPRGRHGCTTRRSMRTCNIGSPALCVVLAEVIGRHDLATAFLMDVLLITEVDNATRSTINS